MRLWMPQWGLWKVVALMASGGMSPPCPHHLPCSLGPAPSKSCSWFSIPQICTNLAPSFKQHRIGVTPLSPKAGSKWPCTICFGWHRTIPATSEKAEDEGLWEERPSHSDRSPPAHLSPCSPSWASSQWQPCERRVRTTRRKASMLLDSRESTSIILSYEELGVFVMQQLITDTEISPFHSHRSTELLRQLISRKTEI